MILQIDYYIKKFDIQKIKLPFSKKEYESFIHNLSPDRYDETGYFRDSEYYNGFLYNDEEYCREVTSSYDYLKLVKFYDLGNLIWMLYMEIYLKWIYLF